jgi:hypothetical protein
MPAPLHVPVAAYAVKVVAVLQAAGGGVLHVTPVHGSGLHAPLVQPNMQALFVGA